MSSDAQTLFTRIDAYLNTHTHPSSRPNTSTLSHTLSSSKSSSLPDIALSPAQAKFLALFLRATHTTTALELGTLGGYTSIFLASENPQLHITTVEIDPHNAEVARKNVSDAGLEGRIDVIEGAGVDVIKQLQEEVREGKREKFGFVFIDADKENNWTYFDVAAGITVPRGVIVVDNVVRGGRIVDESLKGEKRIAGAREVIEKAGRDGRVDSTVLQTVGEKGHDGWLWAVVK